MKKILSVFLPPLLLFFTGCKKEPSGSSFSSALITSFKFEAAKNPQLHTDIIAEIGEGTITASLPLGVRKDALIPTFTTNGAVASVRMNGTEQISGITANNFSNSGVYTVNDKNSSSRQYIVSIYSFTGLPVVYITTTDNALVTSKDDYVSGRISIDSNAASLASLPLTTMQIKLHGNSTASLPKKPYKIKLDSKASLAGMPADKEWLLLANYTDKTLLRNYLAFEASKIFGMPYTPRSQFVEVFLNGEYQGNYQLTEQIKIATGRVNIKEMDEADVSASKITGGYLMEIDTRLDEPNYFITGRNVPVTLKDPDYGVAVQNDYIHTYVQQMEDVLFSDTFSQPTNGYAKYLNPQTAIKWFWVNELFKNIDALFNSSVYMYKDRGGIVNFGPVWDFDVAGGNNFQSGTGDPEGWYVKKAVWFDRLFKDPAFTTAAIAQWEAVRGQLNNLISMTDDMSAKLKYSQKMNFKQWNILNTYVWPNAVVLGSYDAEVNYLKSWLKKRMEWIDGNLQTLSE